jgi:hypothetical protein
VPIEPVDGYGFFYQGEFYPIREGAPAEEPPPSPYREVLPWLYPYDHMSFWNTPVGSGATYVSTSDVRHTSTFSGSEFNLTYNNWSDPFYLSDEDDPIMEIVHRTDLPSGWPNVANNQTGPDGGGDLRQRYTGVRIPAEATWQSTSNTDRKCIVIQGQETTLSRYNASNNLVETKVYPPGTLSIEIHKFYRVTGQSKILCTNLSYSDLRGYGMGYGALASGVAMSQGYVRRWEIEAALAGDHTAIRHALKIGLPGQKLKTGQIWPASHQDGDTTGYTGHNPMGSMFVLNKDTNIEALSYTGTDDAKKIQKAFAWTLQNFGGYVLIRSGNGPIGLGIESTPPHLSGTLMTAVRSGLTSVVFPHMRIVSNSNDVGSLRSDRHPNDPSRIAGGGTHNESIRPLPIDPEGPWL